MKKFFLAKHDTMSLYFLSVLAVTVFQNCIEIINKKFIIKQ